MPSVQIYGLRESDITLAARRFFASREIDVEFINLADSPMFPIDLLRFTDKFTLPGLLDTASDAYRRAGFQTRRPPESEILSTIESSPDILLLPLVNGAGRLSIGDNRGEWTRIAAGLSSKG